MTVKHPEPKVIAAYLKRIATQLEARGDTAVTTAGLLADRGYPASSNGGSRSSDTTSSTERAALNPDGWTGISDELAQAMRGLWHQATQVEHLLAKVLAHASGADPIPVGRGNCAACDHFCTGDGGNDRLRNLLCHTCTSAYSRWRKYNPYGTKSDFITMTKRDRRDHGATRNNAPSATLTR